MLAPRQAGPTFPDAAPKDPAETPRMDLTHAALGDLVTSCREETGKFQRGEPSRTDSCWEILRRAISQRDHAAWEAVVTQYRGIVLGWVHQHSASAHSREGADYWVNRTFERLWMAVGPERFSQFSNLPSLLKYLKMCVHSVLMDDVRARRAAEFESLDTPGVRDRLDASASAGTAAENAEELVLGELAGRELWQVILDEVPDEIERLVFYWSFALDLKPGEIHSRSPERYPTVADVYRIKRNVLDRLRRSPRLRQHLQQLAS